MSGRNENSSEQKYSEYSDSTSELEEDITTTLLSDIGLEPYKCEPIAYLCCKEVAVLGGEKFAVNVNKSSDFTNIELSVCLKVGISVP